MGPPSDPDPGLRPRTRRTSPVSPVAVIGAACRLPGGIDTPEQLWDALLRGDDLVTEIPPDRWDPDEYDDADAGASGRTPSRHGAFLDDVAGFDLEFFGIDERAAAASDPQHRLLLETSWEAVEHAGLAGRSVTGTPTGVFVGLTHADYPAPAVGADGCGGPYGLTGTSFSLASGRIARALGLHGPALTVDTACSSGLTAVHLACRSLHEGETDLALAGGATVLLDPRKWASGSTEGLLSSSGRCRPFDAAADGFIPGEGCVTLLLKRLPDAQRDADRILAVILGTAVNQDGHTASIATPSPTAQVAVYLQALAAAGVDAGAIGMVEAHGTGTRTGDPVEYAGLAEVYGRDAPCALAAVKGNFGHIQAASGTLGLLKAVLAVQHGVVPRNLHYTRPADAAADTATNLFVPLDNTPFPRRNHGPRLAAVSSHGMSGTNVHAIVAQAPDLAGTETCAADFPGPALLFPLSATSTEALRRSAGRLADWLAAHDDVSLSDLAYTLARRRLHRTVRATVSAGSVGQLTDSLREIVDGDTPGQAIAAGGDRGPVWVFSGQDARWTAAGAELLATEPVFAGTVARVEPVIAGAAGFSVSGALSTVPSSTDHVRIQPALFTLQVGLAAALGARGVRPGAVIGHSLGEAAAAVVAGALSLEDGARLVCRRARLMSRIAGSGATAVVELPAKQILSELTVRGIRDVVVAAVISPQSTVVAGAAQVVRELVESWEQRSVLAHEVPFDVAVHSSQVDPIIDELAGALADLHPMPPQVPFYSTTLFDPRDPPWCDAAYWTMNMRRMVRFGTAVQAALDDGYHVFAELAPDPLLTRALEQAAQGRGVAMASICRKPASTNGLLGFVADLHDAGALVDFSQLYPSGRLVDAPLPAWTHQRVWLPDGTLEPARANGHAVTVHPLLGPHVHLQEEPERHVWQADLGSSAPAWLADHTIHEAAVLPGPAYCDMALAAAHVVHGDACEVRDVQFGRPLLLGEQTTVCSTATTSSSFSGAVEFTVETTSGSEHTRHATAVLNRAVLNPAVDERPPAHDIPALLAAHPRRVDGAEARNRPVGHGIRYGPSFGGLSAVHLAAGSSGTLLAEITVPRPVRPQLDSYCVHPALLDACFQSVQAHPHIQAIDGDGFAPLGVRLLRSYGPTRDARYCYARVARTDPLQIEFDLEILDGHGAVLLVADGLRFSTGSEQARRERALADGLLTVDWLREELPASTFAEAGTWLLISANPTADAVADALTAALTARGAQCSTLRRHPDAGQAPHGERLGDRLRTGGLSGVVILGGARTGHADDQYPMSSRDHVRQLAHIIGELPRIPVELPRLYVVTRHAHSVLPGDRPNLEQAGLWGLIRVLGAEYPHLGATQIDMDDATGAERLAEQLITGSDEDETAWRNGHWYVARLRCTPLRPEERRITAAHHDRDGIRLQLRAPGDPNSLEIVSCDRIPPGPGQIEVAVTAAGVNFADVLVAFGRYPACDGQSPRLGSDFVGVVTAVGPDVTVHGVGDRVGGLSPDGCWGTFVTCDARLAVALPAGLTDQQAAAVTTAHATAWYGLNDLARIEAGDKVLIHSATGGVGQAAVAIARAAGAEIFATAGSEQRRQLLSDHGITHVYDSRTVEFADLIRSDTGGYGVDIVLNSVTGAAQRAGVELLAFGGRFVEIGKRDIYGDTKLGLFPFRRNLAFYALDLALLSVSRPEQIGHLLTTVYRLTADGLLPMPASTRYPLSDAGTALAQMNAALHSGKLILDIPHAGGCDVVLPPEQFRAYRPDSSYIITGGLGSLGLFFAETMAAGGCGLIVLTSRSRPDPRALEAIERIRAGGTEVLVECGDIAVPATAHRLVEAATAGGLPLRGVLHAAGVVEDAILPDTTDEVIEHHWAPKVYGAWNMHTATAGQPLDWFCSFSSATALVGSPGQGAYAAANSWLDAFTRWRRARGLPATAIAWGTWGRGSDGAIGTEGNGLAITPDEGAYVFESLLRHDRAYTGYAPMSGNPWLTAFAQHSPFTQSVRSLGQRSAGASELRAELDGLPRAQWHARLERVISDEVSQVMRRNIEPDRALSEYGLDSLGALELRNRVESATGVRIAITDITTIHALAGLLCETLAPARVLIT